MRSSIPTQLIFVSAMLFSALFLQPAVVAQNSSVSTAPVVWERYKASGRNESVLLPKLPTATAVEQHFPCSDLNKAHYYAYAEDAVYEFTVAWKGKLNAYPPNCQPKRFGQQMFDDRLKELRDEKSGESPATRSGLEAFEFVSSAASRWVFPDLKNGHWIELAIHHRPNVQIDDSKFTGSLNLSGGEGKDIGDGSPVTLGDAYAEGSTMPVTPGEKDMITAPLRIISKPMAPYTEAARRANEQGHVTLKIVFLANGGIGSVTVVDGLRYGLTETAVAAAKRVAFIPKKVNGAPVDVSMTFQYGFNIY